MLKRKIALLVAVVMAAVMALPMAANFTPSATAKPAPEVVPSYEDYAAVLVDENGNIIAGITGPELIVTPHINKDEAPHPEITKNIEEAFAEINSVDSLAELCAELDSIIKEYAPELSADTVIVGDLFDVTVISEKGEILARDDVYLKVRFKLTYDAADLISILHKDGDEWKAIPNSRIIRNDDNTVDVWLTGTGVLAFLVDSGELIVPEGPDSPQTGAAEDYSFVGAFICSVSALVCTAAAITVAKKKQETK